LPIGLEHVVEEQVHHLVSNESFFVRFASHALIGVLVGSVVGLVEVHLAFRLSGRYAEEGPVSRRQRGAPSATS
jgi:hypothetical protein